MEERFQVSPRNPDGTRGRVGTHLGPVRITPTRVMLAVALIGSLLYIAFAVTVRDAGQIPMLSSGAAILGIVFGALAVAGAVSFYRAATEARHREAFVLAFLGGLAALAAFGSFAVAVVLALVWRAR